MNYLILVAVLAFAFGVVTVAGVGYYLHRKHVDSVAVNSAKTAAQAVADAATAAVKGDVQSVAQAVSDAVGKVAGK